MTRVDQLFDLPVRHVQLIVVSIPVFCVFNLLFKYSDLLGVFQRLRFGQLFFQLLERSVVGVEQVLDVVVVLLVLHLGQQQLSDFRVMHQSIATLLSHGL